MKFNLSIIALLALLTATAFFVSGCTGFQKALEIAERTEAQFEAAAAELTEAYQLTEQARDDYLAALEEGDGDQVQAALAALKTAEQQYRERELDFNETQRAFELAQAELKDAEGTDDYFWGILGLLGGIFGGAPSGFAVGKRRGRKE